MRPAFVSREMIVSLFAFTLLPLGAFAQWTPPTPEELSMTTQSQVPGAPAVILYKEEFTDDDNHFFSTYIRLKVLTDRGKEKANVEITYPSGGEAHVTIEDLAGRTIHADGTIVPFTGKPFEKLVEKTGGVKIMSKVFSLPDVQVGSILEYRYKTRYEDNYYISPNWYIQSELYLRKGHYVWKPTSHELQTESGSIQSLSWFPILPAGAAVKVDMVPGGGYNGPRKTLTLDVADVLPTPTEDFLPPMQSLTDRVLFYYSEFRSADDFWNNTGKSWSKDRDKFIGPNSGVKSEVQKLVAPTDEPREKLRKIYNEVMSFENTSFTRERTTNEELVNGAKAIRTTDDVLSRKRGTDDQLTELFVAMARAAGFKAYLAGVANRDERIFMKGYQSLRQIDDYIAIVNLDGKDVFFDPGQRYMPFQHMAWKHTMAAGLRQQEKGTGLFEVPSEPYTASKVERLTDLKLAEDGEATGTIRLIYSGVAGVHWRQESLRGDSTSLNHDLEESCQHLMGSDMEVHVQTIENLSDFEKPLTIRLTIHGPIATSAGRRLLVPSDLFESQAHPTFPGQDRKFPVYFHFPHIDQDVVHIVVPEGMTIESLPKSTNLAFKKLALYFYKTEQTPNAFIIRRDFLIGEIFFPVDEYPELRKFFNSFEAQDHEPVVLKPSAPAGPKAAGN